MRQGRARGGGGAVCGGSCMEAAKYENVSSGQCVVGCGCPGWAVRGGVVP